jgi:8-oxo-dGTP pyrophosphatase MutT (NUDIX family)
MGAETTYPEFYRLRVNRHRAIGYMGSTRRKKLRASEIPTVLYASVPLKALRRALRSRLLYRLKGKPLVLYDRRSRAARRANGTRVVLRIAGRMAAAAGSEFFNGRPGRFETESIPIKFAACTKLPCPVRGLAQIDAAGGVVVAPNGKPRVLLLRKRERPANRWVLPKGKRQPQEARRNAARREVLEESGLARVDVGPYLMRERYFDVESGRVVFKEVSYYLMRVPKGKTRLKVNRAEGFAAGKWMSFDDALAATNPVRAHRSLRKARTAIKAK